ncbi:BRO-N domain-containing protein [Embleya sp. NPDC001921]
MTGIERFTNAEFDIETIQDGDSFRVLAPGLARGLGYRDASRMTESLPENEKGYTTAWTLGGEQQVLAVTEPGFYRLLGQRQASRIKNPESRAQVQRFQYWVFHDVLPSLRQHGRYELPGSDEPVPATLTWDHAAAIGRARHGLAMSRDTWRRMLRSGGVLRLNGAPRTAYEDLFWPTETRWEIHAHALPYLVEHALRTWRRIEAAQRNVQMLMELGRIGHEVEGADTPDGFPF